MTLYGAISNLVMMREHPMMPSMFYSSLDKIIETVSECEEPERKKGEWIKQDCGGVEYTAVCSECGYGTFWSDASDFNFCPNCGADMRGDSE